MPNANQDQAQLSATEQFLKSGFITVDIFAVSPVDDDQAGQTAAMRRRSDTVQANSTFAVGEEAEQMRPGGDSRSGQSRPRPSDVAGSALEPGSTARVDVVVRTRKIGHFFPGGTVDAFDVWLELQAKDADGRIDLLERQRDRRTARGPVEPGAHFYRSYQLDGDGNPIDKRNAWQARSLLYVRLIPPGAADVAHLPREGADATRSGPIQLHREAELPQILAGTTRSSPMPDSPSRARTRRCSARDHNGLEYSVPTRHRFPPMSRARSATASRICRS